MSRSKRFVIWNEEDDSGVKYRLKQMRVILIIKFDAYQVLGI